MQKAIKSPSMLSVAFTTDLPAKKIESQLYIVNERNAQQKNKASHLHRLFFGQKKVAVLQTVTYESKADEPDYFSSYE